MIKHIKQPNTTHKGDFFSVKCVANATSNGLMRENEK